MSDSWDDLTERIAQEMYNRMQREWLNLMAWTPATVELSDTQAMNSWTLPDLPPPPEWQYVEDFAGHKLYRRVWPDTPSMHGREEWSASLPASKATLMAGGMCGYGATGSRMELRRAILRNRDMPVHRAADGGLVGWRVWTLCDGDMWTYGDGRRDMRVWSPHQRTRWEGPTLTADKWSRKKAVEGHAGIHASLRPIRATDALFAQHATTGPLWTITGRVRGYGRYVLGTRGWRAERVVIDYLRVPAEIYDEVKGSLSERYQCDIRKQWR